MTNNSIKTAGKALKKGIETKEHLSIISTYRSNHIPLMKMLVKTIAKKLPKPLLIARRLKRLSSIKTKLKRFEQMQLNTMQDIGGVRAVFKNNYEVRAFIVELYKAYKSKKSALNIIKEYDYINEPKQDGYRSFHIVFEYQGNIKELQNYKIELQLRSLLQHYWATAVEILALKSESNLKAGYGEAHYKRFFWLCAELLAGDLKPKSEIKELDLEHNILALLSGLNVAANKLNKNEKTKDFYLVSLDFNSNTLRLLAFDKHSLSQAKEMYQALETSDKIDSVLVSIDSVKKLKKAYPNYFLDAKNFIDEVRKRLKEQ